MTLRRRLDKLEGGRQAPVTVFLTAYDIEGGQPEITRAVVVCGAGRTICLDREAGESEEAFKARIAAAGG